MRPLLIVESEAKARTLGVNAESDMDSVIVQTPPMTVSHDPGAKGFDRFSQAFGGGKPFFVSRHCNLPSRVHQNDQSNERYWKRISDR